MNRSEMKNKAKYQKKLRNPVADKIRMIYILERDEFEATFHHGKWDYRPGNWWDGGRCRNGKTRKSIWPKIALGLKDAGINDPEDYVRYVFEVARVPPPCPPNAPKPNLLLRKAYFQEYRRGIAQRRKNLVSRLQLNLRSMARTLRSALGWWEDYAELIAAGEIDPEDKVLTEIEIVKRVILDTSTELNALFRFCISLNRWPELAATFELTAAYEYVPHREAYDIAWGKFIPEQFRRRADKLYEEACRIQLRGR